MANVDVNKLTLEDVDRWTILKAIVGSKAHGVNIPGTDDTDQMGVCIEPREYVIGLQRFEQYVFRTRDEGERSGPGDLDQTIYSLRKYCKLALAGNPTILLLLFSQPIVSTSIGDLLQQQRPHFWSKRAGRAFLGYMTEQKRLLTGEKTNGHGRRGGAKRPELIERYGFDTKFAGHIIRLGYQGVEYMTDGVITLPMKPGAREHVLDVRNGKEPLDKVLQAAESLEQWLAALVYGAVDSVIKQSKAPEEPDVAAIDRFLIEAYTAHWDKRW
jgi:hypothetical protein